MKTLAFVVLVLLHLSILYRAWSLPFDERGSIRLSASFLRAFLIIPLCGRILGWW